MTVGDLGEKVRRGRRDDDGVGAARQVDVAHPVVGAGGPHVGARPGRPDSACSVSGVTKRQAAAVMQTSTAMPVLTKSRVSSAAL